MHLKENTLFDLWPWGQSHTKCYPVPSTSFHLYVPAKFEVAMSNGLGEAALTRKYIIWPWSCVKVTQNVAQHPLCTCKIWSYYVQWFRRCIYFNFTRKYIPWPWGQGLHETSPSTLYIMWSIYLQSLMLLHPTLDDGLTFGTKLIYMYPKSGYKNSQHGKS